ncbi:MAG: DUF1552 domain-containing protein [Myxococcales bacterium]|nr:DUF1552 domain-containing protein [Myxococcales bacterium]
MSFSRRAMLRAFGASVAALPLLDSLAGRAHAAAPTFPTRLVIVSRGQGTLTDSLVTPGASPTSFTLGPVLQPLQPFRDRLVLCDGLDDASNILDGSYNGHTRCLLHTWVSRGMTWAVGGSGGASPTGAGGASFDQVVASRWKGATAYDSLEFGVNADTQVIQTHCWRGVGQPVPPQNDPGLMYERLFQDLVGTDPAELAARLARRRAVLDAVRGQFSVVMPKVSSDDRTKLENHLASLEQLDQALGGGSVGDACVVPVVDTADSSIPGRSRAMIDMLAMSLACDLTRVATLVFGDYQDWPWLDVDFPSGWHDAVHAGPATPELRDDLTDTYRWFSDQLALLLAALDAIPEGDGTVLDHTLVVYSNVFSTGSSHSHTNKTWLLAGGGGGLRGGRYLDYQGHTQAELFTSLLQGLGFDDTSFGDPTFCDGPLTGVFS